MSQFTNLQSLWINQNNFQAITQLPDEIWSFNGANNYFSEFPSLPSGIHFVDMGFNNIEELEWMPNVPYLVLSNNPLGPDLPNMSVPEPV